MATVEVSLKNWMEGNFKLLRGKNKKLCGFKNIKISHIWTQDQKISKK